MYVILLKNYYNNLSFIKFQFFVQKVDAREFYANEEMRLTALVEEEKKVALSRPLGVAFMTLGQLLFYHNFIIYIYMTLKLC